MIFFIGEELEDWGSNGLCDYYILSLFVCEFGMYDKSKR